MDYAWVLRYADKRCTNVYEMGDSLDFLFFWVVRRDSSLVAHTYVRIVPALMIKFKKKKVTPFASISFTQSKGTPNACNRSSRLNGCDTQILGNFQFVK